MSRRRQCQFTREWLTLITPTGTKWRRRIWRCSRKAVTQFRWLNTTFMMHESAYVCTQHAKIVRTSKCLSCAKLEEAST